VRHLVRVAFVIGVFASALPAADPGVGPAPALLVVGQEPGAPYASIQAAVDAAPDGAAIGVGPGAYDGAVRIARPPALQGAGWDKTTVVAPQPPAELVMQAQRETAQQFRQAMEAKDEENYIHVRRIGNDLIDRLDTAVGALNDAKALVIDVRGNSGSGFDFERSHRKFNPDETVRQNAQDLASGRGTALEAAKKHLGQ
jgi:hypothetical protein